MLSKVLILILFLSVSVFPKNLDFNNDNIDDYTVFRPSNSVWYTYLSNNSVMYNTFGLWNSDILCSSDFDGDGKVDIAVWRNNTGTFYVNRSLDNTVSTLQFGKVGDEPIVGRWDNDLKSDFAIVRRSNNLLFWYIVNSSTNTVRIEQFGISDDYTSVGDYDGDGLLDISVQRNQGGVSLFYTKRSSDNSVHTQYWGLPNDFTAIGDYDGDGKDDYCVIRPQGGRLIWYVLKSSNGSYEIFEWGLDTDYIAIGDYNGDNKIEPTVWRESEGRFYVKLPNFQFITKDWGTVNDYPVANQFVS